MAATSLPGAGVKVIHKWSFCLELPYDVTAYVR